MKQTKAKLVPNGKSRGKAQFNEKDKKIGVEKIAQYRADEIVRTDGELNEIVR